MSSKSECNVCAEVYNKSSRKVVSCICGFECCRECVKTYILGTKEDAACMSCKVVWERKFLADNLGKTFMSKEYKDYREELLVEREMGLLQGTQPYVEREIRMEKLEEEIADLRVEYYKKLGKLETELRELKNGGVVEKKKFVRKCPNGDCHGFLSSALKCELCGCWACGECREIKGFKTEEKELHECNKEILESVKLLDKDSKGCPKCSALIFKIEGCFKGDTPILMWDQSIKMSQDIKIGDILIGDDGEKRYVLDTCQGEDDMYEVIQNNGERYVVNSKHKLALKGVGSGDVIEILVDDYMKLTDKEKKYLYGFKSSNGVNYEEKIVDLDPYMLGLWLGDGTHTHPIIASNDIEIQKYILEWCKKNDAELIHDEAVKFRIRRKGKTNGISDLRNPIGKSSVNTCKGCTYKSMEICDIQEEDNRDVYKSKTNPFMNKLSKYNLVGNKHIPQEYMMNSRNIRLQVLAGLIDTDGCVLNDGKRISIGQVNHRLAKQIELLCYSLGYVINSRIIKRNNVKCPGVDKKNYKDSYQLNISGNISEIPTILYRKKCKDSIPNKDYQKTSIDVKCIGRDKYYGWKISGNKRFVGVDFTVLRNCDQMYCVECHTAFSWRTLKVESGVIHNPHYFEYQRRVNNGVVGRNPLDVQCGRELDNDFVIALMDKFDPLPKNWRREVRYGVVMYYNGNNRPVYDRPVTKDSTNLIEVCRQVMHVRFVEQPRFVVEDRLNSNIRIRIDYMRNVISRDEMKKLLQKREKELLKKGEIGNVLGMYVTCMTDIFYRMLNENENATKIKNEMNELKNYTNDCFKKISKTYNCKEYNIDSKFRFN